MTSTAPAIVVGADGSPAAARAAVWALDEAVSRKIGLRLLGGPESATALLDASRTAAMVCVGGTTAPAGAVLDSALLDSALLDSALLDSAHCPVAVVRGTGQGPVVVEIDDTPASAAVLQFAAAEARLRSAPLRVVGTRGARLDDRPEQWRQRYPDLDAAPVRGDLLAYLTGRAIALVVLGAGNPSARTVLDHTECTLLVVDRQRLL